MVCLTTVESFDPDDGNRVGEHHDMARQQTAGGWHIDVM